MFGNTIALARKKKGLTLSELSERTNISKSYLSNIERNINRNPSIMVMSKLAAVLNIDIKELLLKGSCEDPPILEKEWVNFVNELKASGIETEQIHQYKTLIEFIKWQNKPSKKKE